MISFAEAQVEQLIIHSIKGVGDHKVINLSEKPVELEEGLTTVLKRYFLDKFRSQGQKHKFSHEFDLMMNELCAFSNMLFNGERSFVEVSQAIANFLYSKSGSANIKDGEVYIAKFKGVVLEDESLEAIGIFKSENKDVFLKVFEENAGFGIEKQEGINIKKLDKGAIILNSNQDDGYRLLVVDQTNKQDQAKYWIEEFLKVEPLRDNFYQTDQILEVFKEINKKNHEEFDGQEKVDLVSSSVEYIERHETFEKNDFYNEVLNDDKRQRLFEKIYEEQTGTLPPDTSSFNISKQAVKKSKRFIRSVIKLDKSFHVYVHTNRDRIEKGFDETKKLNYYKLYFQDEY